MNSMIDSYEAFLHRFQISKEDFYYFGIENTILPPIDKVRNRWEDLKRRVYGNGIVTIRGYGRDGKGTEYFRNLYEYVWKN